MAVGMAMAEKHLAATYNRPGLNVVDHHTYVLCGDGDLMEGLSHEAASLAGTLGLGKLIVLYDDNLISLDGPTEWSFTENVYKRFEAYNWHVQRVQDGNDLDAIEAAIASAKAVEDKPSFIAVRTVIGYGSPRAGTNKVHGEAMGAGGRSGDEEVLRLSRGPELLCARRGAGQLAQGGRSRRSTGSGVEQAVRELCNCVPRAGWGVRADAGRQAAAGWEKAIPSFHDRETNGDAQRGPAGDERDFQRRAGVAWGRGGSDGVDQDDLQNLTAFCTTIQPGAMCFSGCASSECARR